MWLLEQSPLTCEATLAFTETRFQGMDCSIAVHQHTWLKLDLEVYSDPIYSSQIAFRCVGVTESPCEVSFLATTLHRNDCLHLMYATATLSILIA